MEIREIKKNHPRFNSQFNRIRKLAYYQVRKGLLYLSPEGLYGPFLRTRFLENFIESMRYLYPIFITEDSFDFSYDIFGRRLTKKDLAQNSLSLNKILSDEKGMASFTNELRLLMKEAATEMRYERAMYYRDLINSLTYLSYMLFELPKLYRAKILYKEEGPSGTFYYLIHRGEVFAKSKTSDDLDQEMDLTREVTPISGENFEEISLIYAHIRNPEEGQIIAILSDLQ